MEFDRVPLICGSYISLEEVDVSYKMGGKVGYREYNWPGLWEGKPRIEFYVK